MAVASTLDRVDRLSLGHFALPPSPAEITIKLFVVTFVEHAFVHRTLRDLHVFEVAQFVVNPDLRRCDPAGKFSRREFRPHQPFDEVAILA
jgi:hypothetical protein